MRPSQSARALTPQFLRARLADQYAHHYHLIVSILKGVAFYAAATAILDIYNASTPVVVKATATMYWVAGMLAMVTNYDGIMVSSLIITRPPNIIDVVMPFLLGVAEYAHFAQLAPLPSDPVTGASESAQLLHLTWWPLLFAIFTLIACTTITTTQRAVEVDPEKVSPEMLEVSVWYKQVLGEGRRFTGIISMVLIVCFLILREGFPQVWLLDRLPQVETLRDWQGVLAVIVAIGTTLGLLSSEDARRRIVTTVGRSTVRLVSARAANAPAPAPAPAADGPS